MSGETIYPTEHASDRIIPRFDGNATCPRCGVQEERHVCADLPYAHAPYDNHQCPPYLKSGGIEVIDIIEAFVPDKPYRWHALKYLLRCGKKPGQDEITELRKALFWIEREIASIMAKRNSSFRNAREGSEKVGGST